MAGERPDFDHFRPGEVRLGHVSGVFGLQGEVKLFLYNPESDLLEEEREVELVSADGARRKVRMRARSGAGRRIMGEIAGVDSVEAAQALVGQEIVLPEAELPPPEADAWYHRDLIGLPVRTASGEELGRLAEIHSVSEVDTWVIRGRRGECYLPALKELILEVRPGEGITVADGVGETI